MLFNSEDIFIDFGTDLDTTIGQSNEPEDSAPAKFKYEF
jgi:hypothetical protein